MRQKRIRERTLSVSGLKSIAHGIILRTNAIIKTNKVCLSHRYASALAVSSSVANAVLVLAHDEK